MKAAPSRDPEIMAKVWIGPNTPAARRLRGEGAPGEPDRPNSANSQPKPSAPAGESKWKTRCRPLAMGATPSRMKSRASVNRSRARTNVDKRAMTSRQRTFAARARGENEVTSQRLGQLLSELFRGTRR